MRELDDILTEAADSLKGNIRDVKTVRHLRNYVFPFLDKRARTNALKSMGKHMPRKDEDEQHGELRNSATSHILRVTHGPHKKGTKIKAVGAYLDGDQVMIKTKNHGDIPQTRLTVPPKLKKPAITKTGYDVENVLTKNLGTSGQEAGPSADYDFTWPKGVDTVKQIKGKVKTTEASDRPVLRGESKLSKGKIGQSALTHNKSTGKWELSDKGGMAEQFKKAKINGVPLLKYLDENHPKGVIENAITTDAAPGTTRHYMKKLGINTLHIHHKDWVHTKDPKTGKRVKTNELKDEYGTTYTVGDTELAGRTTLGHLGNEHLDALDGKISIERTTTGKVPIVHRPRQTVMKHFASMSRQDPVHRSLYDENHAREFLHHPTWGLHSLHKTGEIQNKTPGGESDFYSNPEMDHIHGRTKK